MKKISTATAHKIGKVEGQGLTVGMGIGSIRRDCLDHSVVLSQRHLRKLLQGYFTYYHRSRTHLALAKDAPESRAIMSRGEIVAIPQVGGLHRRYERHAA